MRGIWAAVLIALSVVPVHARNIAECGASAGWGFFPKSALVENKDANRWVQDGISNGRIVLSQGADGSFDLLYGDTISAINSASKDGGVIVQLGQTRNSIAILVSYPGSSAETYVFRTGSNDTKEVLWTANKYGTLIPNVRAMRAPCRFILVP